MNQPPDDASFLDHLARAAHPDLPPAEALRRVRVANTYDHLVADLGTQPHAVLWPGKKGQRARFRALMRVFGWDRWRGGISVADLGCGYGALFDVLRWSPALRGGSYRGYDISSRMVAAARRRIADPRARFEVADMADETADYALCSGTFGIKAGESDAVWAEHVEATLIALAGHCRKGLAFNMLDERARDHRDQELYYTTPRRWAAFARETMAPDRRPRVKVISSGIEDDFTVLVRFRSDGH